MKKQLLVVLLGVVCIGQLWGGEFRFQGNTYTLDDFQMKLFDRLEKNNATEEEWRDVLRRWFPQRKEFTELSSYRKAGMTPTKWAPPVRIEPGKLVIEGNAKAAVSEEATKHAEKTRKAQEQLEIQKHKKAEKERLAEEARKAAEAETERLAKEVEEKAERERREEEAIRKEAERKAKEEAEAKRLAEEAERARLKALQLEEEIRAEEAAELARMLALQEEALKREAQEAAEEEARQLFFEEQEALKREAEAAAEEEARQLFFEEQEALKEETLRREAEQQALQQPVAVPAMVVDEQPRYAALELILEEAAGAQTIEQQAAVVARIPGFSKLLPADKNILTPYDWETDSTQYYIALIAVQQVLNYFLEYKIYFEMLQLAEDERAKVKLEMGKLALGNPHLDNRDIIGSHFMEMYQKMLGYQITTEFDLRDENIAQAVNAIAQLNENFREACVADPAATAAVVLDFESTLPGMPTHDIIADVTQLQPGQGRENSSGEASGWMHDSSGRNDPNEFGVMLDQQEINFMQKVKTLVSERHSDFLSPAQLQQLDGQRAVLVSFVREHPVVSNVPVWQISLLFEQLQESVDAQRLYNEIQAMKEEVNADQGFTLSAAASPATARKQLKRQDSTFDIDRALDDPSSGKLDEWGTRFSNIIASVTQAPYNEEQRLFLKAEMEDLVGKSFQGINRLDELMDRLGIDDFEKSYLKEFVNTLRVKENRTFDSLAHVYHFTLEKNGDGKTIIQGMPALTKYLSLIGPKIAGILKGQFWVATVILKEGEHFSEGISKELKEARTLEGERSISQEEIRKMLTDFYIDLNSRGRANAIRDVYLDQLATSIFGLQFNKHGKIHINPDDVTPVGSGSTIARVLREYQAQKQGEGPGMELIDIVTENKGPLQLELAEMKRQDTRLYPPSPFNWQEINDIVREKAESIKFTDEDALNYLTGLLSEIHQRDPMFQ
jgi:hypothetical protein